MTKPDYDRLYKTARWKRLRKQHLARYPYCQCPHHLGQRVLGNVVDHIEPHRGDTRLFWNPDNLQTLTTQCHCSFKQSEEKGGAGFLQGCDARGWPLDPAHSWNRGTVH